MSIASYFNPRNGLPDHKGPLSASLSSRAIAMANQETEKAISEAAKENTLSPFFSVNAQRQLPSFSPLQRTGHDRCVVPARIIILHHPLPPKYLYRYDNHGCRQSFKIFHSSNDSRC